MYNLWLLAAAFFFGLASVPGRYSLLFILLASGFMAFHALRVEEKFTAYELTAEADRSEINALRRDLESTTISLTATKAYLDYIIKGR